jgi:hypothetical protein
VAITFNKISKIITVEAPATEVTIQELINEIRNWEDELHNMEEYKVADCTGKEELGGGVYVGLTLKLIDWKLKFEDRVGPTTIVCDVSGGNLVMYNSIADAYQNPIEPSTYITVTKTSSSSATLQELGAIQYSSFNGGVTIDVVNGTAGTAFPIGTPEQPVKNVADAVSIAVDRGLNKLYIKGDITFTTGDTIDNYIVQGETPQKSTITLDAGASTVGCTFKNATIQGTLDGNSWIEDCYVLDVTYVEGMLVHSTLAGTITLAGTSDTMIKDCGDGVAGSGTPIIDFGGSGRNLTIGCYCGDIRLQNKNGADSIQIELVAGRVILDSDVTAGDVTVRGVGILEDNSTGTTSVDSDGLVSLPTIADAIWDEDLASYGPSTAGELVKRIVGLSHENVAIDQTTYDSDNNLTSARLRVYSDKASVGTDSDVLASYLINATGAGVGRFTVWKQVKQ